MNRPDLLNILPLIMLAGSATLILIVITIKRNHLLVNVMTLLLLAACTAILFLYPPVDGVNEGLFASAGFGSYAIFLFVLSAVVVTALSYSFLERQEINREEYYVLILLGTLGAASMAVSNHFISFLLGLELLSISIFVMSGYLKLQGHGTEASVKYLVLATVSSSFLLMGMALVFAATGTMDFSGIGSGLSGEMENTHHYILAGTGLIIVGAGFKMAVVPFHMWVADVYQGSPAPTAGFIASISKGAIVATLLGLFVRTGLHHDPSIRTVLAVISILSMLSGNILALLQTNIRRILGYSSVAHLGYILIPFVSGGILGTESVAYYLLVYMISILGAFGLILLLEGRDGDAQEMEDFRGLFWSKPWMAFAFTVMLLSLAGIPATAGFIGKFYILAASLEAGDGYLAIILIISSVIGLFYYLRIVVEMFRDRDRVAQGPRDESRFTGGAFILSFLMLLVLWIGLFPGSVLKLIYFLMGDPLPL